MTPKDLERGFGLAPSRETAAQDQVRKRFPRSGIQPLPEPVQPGRASAGMLGIEIDPDEVKFVITGDSGGINNPVYQRRVTDCIVDDLVADPNIAFIWHVGDVVYFNGEATQYAAQFYEPYAHFNRPIVAIPGNHDGDVATDDAGTPTNRRPLDTFMENFCDTKPNIPRVDPLFEYGRHTQTQPYCYWTLELDHLTIVGLYSNVPSGGYLDGGQISWLENELKDAPTDVPLIVALHHPPYSVDAHHGGSAHMGEALDGAFTAAGRWPEMVIAGHVHDYQRFTRNVNGKAITYLVIGNSGYYHIHPLAGDTKFPMPLETDDHGDVTFENGDGHNWGYLVMDVKDGVISGEYVSVDKLGTPKREYDTFQVGM